MLRIIILALLLIPAYTIVFSQNAIVTENELTGNPSTEWDISGAGDLTIQGFATDISVNTGGIINFKIDVDPVTDYSIKIYRLGYYGGNGARLIADLGIFTGVAQPEPIYDIPTGKTDCDNWSESASWTTTGAVSGLYIAKLTRTDDSGSSHIAFVVRNDGGNSALLFKTSDATWQAYNGYGGNSLYVNNSGTPVPGFNHATKVSYNRPFTTRGGGGGSGSSEDWLFNAEYPMIRWIERNGYDVSYTTDLDMDRDPTPITTSDHKILLSVGHDEYWSAAERTKWEDARDAGVHLAFFSGNEVYWKTRWEDNHRTLVCYKEGTLGENICGGNCDPTDIWTGLWRDGCAAGTEALDACNPENTLTGQISWDGSTQSIIVPYEYKDLRLWRNTSIPSLTSGQSVTFPYGTLGYEWDWEQYFDFYPPGRITLSKSTYGSHTHKLSLYRHTSGALVFGAGTCQWSWGLDSDHDRGSAAPSTDMQQATVNLFADMGVQPGTLQTGLTAAVASADVTPPVSIITSPFHGADFPENSPITISGTASDVGGILAGVDISVDGGTTWKPAIGTSNWTFTWYPDAQGTVTILSHAFDDSGNIEASGTAPAGNAISLTISEPVAPTCPCTIWNPSTVPLNIVENDPNAYELGVKFKSTEDGFITGVRFYKSTANNGTHIGNLWSSDGTNLATATFINETTSGWQEVSFGTPVEITAGTTYVASYHTTTGYYSEDENYFTTSGVSTFYLEALANEENNPNGVYTASAVSAFPASGYNESNYYVDVVFMTEIGPDVTPPIVVTEVPQNGSSNVSVNSNITASFNEPLDINTVNSNTVLLAGSGTISGVVSCSGNIATFNPDESLEFNTTYTATLKGGTGYDRIKDIAGNALIEDFEWTFTTSGPPPTQGPGGPILVIHSAAQPYSLYPTEILLAEGFNEFLSMDISLVNSTVLDAYDVVILGNCGVSGSFVTAITDWVDAGGTLIALRPDTQLESLLGLTSTGGTLSDGYILVNTSSGPGIGIVNETIQYHSEADLYNLNGATSIATLYSDVSTATLHPAVSQNLVGSNGGKAYAFTYDLARSVVYTHQGNPAWIGQDRDGISPIRANDLFYGNASSDPQADWINLDKVEIPQADEQQRLLANIIVQGNLHRKPLPRFWFLPSGHKAAIVMTGDNHGDAGMAPRFDIDISLSPAGCSVDDWECVRSTGYLYMGNNFTNEQAVSYNNLGFETAIHINTNCSSFTPAQFESFVSTDLADFAAKYTGIPAPSTNRNHCIAWSDWSSVPEITSNHGIRLDVNYYYWPNDWVANRPGMFIGSGNPMRFAKLDGSIIDCYQVNTNMQDENGTPASTNEYFCNTLLDNAIGTKGYYGVFGTNMHFDHVPHAGANAIVASAQARGVPVVSAKQMLDWLDGRNGSSFESITWNTNELSFTINTGVGALNLRGMLPVLSDNGILLGLSQDGGALSYDVETIKGIDYAFFEATDGDYSASYGTDEVGPVISNIIATPAADGTAIITWSTSEAADSKVDYDTNADPLTLSATDASLVTNHSITLTGLLPNTTYHYRVTSVDGFTNSTTEPNPPAVALQFATPAGICAQDQTATNFNLGLPDANTLVVLEDDGAVILKPFLNEEFSGTVVPSGWTEATWATGGVSTFDENQVTVDGTHLSYNTTVGPGTSIEFVATFTSGDYQNIGFTGDPDFDVPWIVIGRGNQGDNNLYARTNPNQNVLLGSDLLNSPHKYRIQWLASTNTFEFYVDDILIPTPSFTVAVSSNMYIQISDYPAGGQTLSVDWLRISPYPASGSYTSRIFNQGSPNGWGDITWSSFDPANTSLSILVQTGDTPTPDGSWTVFSPVTNGTTIGGSHQFLQYRADFTTADNSVTPILKDLNISCGAGPDISPPVITNVITTTGQDGTTANINWDTDELSTSLVEYGTESNNLLQSVSDATLTLSRSLGLIGLSPETTYFFRVTSEDASSNSTSEPVSPGTLSFTTPVATLNCFNDQINTDFELGTISDVYISNVEDGEVILKPTAASEFTVLPPPNEWTSYQWVPGSGSTTISAGSLIVDGTRFNTEPPSLTFGQGDKLEFVATFSATPYQHIGYGSGTNDITTGGVFNTVPWAMFSTGTGGTELLARVAPTGGSSTDYSIPGSYLGAPHHFKIEWLSTGFNFYIDENLVHFEPIVISDPMRIGIGDYNAGGTVLSVDWIHASPFVAAGTFESRIYDAGTPRLWGTASWTDNIPSSTTLQISQRQSSSDITILSEPWIAIPSNGATIGGTSQYIQYKADFTTSDSKETATLKDIVFTCSSVSNMAPIITLEPSSQSVCEGEDASFISEAIGNPIPTIQWQESSDGSTWTDIVGETGGTLSLLAVDASFNGYQFQAVWTNSEGITISNTATLTVNALPTATITALNTNLCQGTDIELQLASATGTAPFDLEVNGEVYTGINQGEIFATIPPIEHTIWESSATPANPDGNDGSPIEVGVKFQSDVAGLIKGIRFYNGTNTTGTYDGNLWTTDGTLLATATFTNLTTNEWQEVRFVDPVYIEANTTYIASYFSTSGFFAITLAGMGTAFVNPPLTALATGTDGPNGVYIYGGGFPSNGNNGNYWADVIFEEALTAPQLINFNLTSITSANGCNFTDVSIDNIDVTINPPPIGNISGPISECAGNEIYLTYNETAGTEPYSLIINGATFNNIYSGTPFNSGVIATAGSGDLTIWPESLVGGTQTVDPNPIELGIIFRTTEAGSINGIRFYKTGTDVLNFTGSLWEIGGALLATANYTSDNTVGWKQINFTTPVSIEANTNYMASYFSPSTNYYAYTPDGMSSPVINAPLTAESSWYKPSGGYPTTSSTANYWVDISFTTGGSHVFTLSSIEDIIGCSNNNVNESITVGVNPTSSINGFVNYYNSALTPLNGVQVDLERGGVSVYNTNTDVNGYFEILDICQGDYDLVATYGIDPGGINATDAALLNYWGVAPWEIEKVKFYAGDANLTNYLDASDAGKILQFFVNNSGFPISPPWKFWPTGDLINSNPGTSPTGLQIPAITIGSSALIANFYGQSTGDFNQSFIPGFTKAASESLSLNYVNTIYASIGDELALPIYAGMDLDLGAVSLILDFPANRLEIIDIFLSGNPSSPLLYNITGGEIRIGWNSLIPLYLNEGDDLITLMVKIIDDPGTEGIKLSLVADPLNELANSDFTTVNDGILYTDVIHTATLGLVENNSNDKLELTNHPNPFKGTTNFDYYLPKDGKVILEIFDLVGNKVMTLIDETQAAGKYNLKLDANKIQPGVYTANLSLKNKDNVYRQTIKIISK